MRGALNVIAASGGSIKATAGDSADVGQTASVLPIPVPIGNTTVTVAGGATPTNAVITLTQAVPGVGNSATIFDDEFTSAPWQPHRLFQAGDKWAYTSTLDTTGSGQSDTADTWWANPIATPQALTVYPPPSGGALSLGLMTTPTGIGITQAFIGTLINNQRSGGLHLYGYHEMQVSVTATRGFLFHWDIEDYPNNPTWTVEMDLDIWTDSAGVQHVRFSLPPGQPTNPNLTIIYQTTTLDITQLHIYGLNWQSDHITAYIDGLAVGQINNPGGDFQSQPCFGYFLTSAASYNVGDGTPTAGALPTFATIGYYRLFSNIPTTAGVVLVHAFNAGGNSNTIIDAVGQNWVRHPDSRLGSAPALLAISNNTLPMAAGQTITVGFTNPNTNTPGQAAAWYVPFVNGSAFGSLANVGAAGATPNAPSITTSATSNTTIATLVTLPTSGPALDTGVVQVQYRLTGTTPWSGQSPAPPTYITPLRGSILDRSGNTWTLASNGNPVINTTVTDTVSHAQELFLFAGTFWQFDGAAWYSFTPTGTITSAAQLSWAGPVATSPLLSPGIATTGLTAGATYDVTAYVSNSVGAGALSAIAQVTMPGGVGSGATLFDDFNTLNLYHYLNPQPGQIWEPVYFWVPAGAQINSTWLVNPDNTNTPLANAYTVSGGTVSFRLDNTPAQFAAAMNNLPFVGGSLQTGPTFSQTFGYFEIRCAVQPLAGSIFSFNLYCPNQGFGNEIDVIEIVTPQSGAQYGGFAIWDATGTQDLNQFYTYNATGVGTIDPSQMHAYGVYITASTTTFYIDRVAQNSWPTPSGYNVPLYLWMGFSDAGSQGTITNTGALPIFAQVDYVGVWTAPPFGAGTGPIASSPFLTADFTLPQNYPGLTSTQQVVSQRMYGTYMGYGADAANRGGTNTNSFAAYTNPAFAAAMAIANPGLFVVTGNTTFEGTPFWTNDGFGNPTVVNPTAMANLVNNFYKVDPLGISGILFGNNYFDPFTGNILYTPTVYGQMMGNLAAWWNNNGNGRLMPNGKPVPFIGCIGHNEPDGKPVSTTASYYSAMISAVKAVSSSYVVLGPIWSFYQGSNTNSFIQACTTKPDGISWDAFNDGNGSSSPLGSAMYTNPTYAKSFESPGIADLFAGDMPAGYTPTSVMVAGNVGFNGNRPDMWTVNAAMFFAVNHWNNLSACQAPMWLATWDDGGQGFNGLVGDTSVNQNGSGIVVTPTAYYFGAGVRNVFGPRWSVTTNPNGLMTIATTPGTGRFGMMIINPGLGNKNGTVALSHVPLSAAINAQGNGTINMWQMTSAVQGTGQDGARSTVTLTGGVTTSISFPDPSITILYV